MNAPFSSSYPEASEPRAAQQPLEALQPPAERSGNSPQSGSNRHPPEYRSDTRDSPPYAPPQKPPSDPRPHSTDRPRSDTFHHPDFPPPAALRSPAPESPAANLQASASPDSTSPFPVPPRVSCCPQLGIHRIHNPHHRQTHRIRIRRRLPHRLVIRRHQHNRA